MGFVLKTDHGGEIMRTKPFVPNRDFAVTCPQDFRPQRGRHFFIFGVGAAEWA